MKPPFITAAYVAVLALLYAALNLQVVRLGRRNRVGCRPAEPATGEDARAFPIAGA
jgi:hypothetical protein